MGNITVIYIMGAGHSGSTLLDTVLGNHPGIQSCGELKNTFFDNLQNNMTCSYGVEGQSCSFWYQVIKDFINKTKLELANYRYLQNVFEHSSIKQHQNIEYNTYRKHTRIFLNYPLKIEWG